MNNVSGHVTPYHFCARHKSCLQVQYTYIQDKITMFQENIWPCSNLFLKYSGLGLYSVLDPQAHVAYCSLMFLQDIPQLGYSCQDQDSRPDHQCESLSFSICATGQCVNPSAETNQSEEKTKGNFKFKSNKIKCPLNIKIGQKSSKKIRLKT